MKKFNRTDAIDVGVLTFIIATCLCWIVGLDFGFGLAMSLGSGLTNGCIHGFGIYG